MKSNIKDGFLGFLLRPKTPQERTHRAIMLGFLVLPVLGTLGFIIYAFMTMEGGN
jgi:hypothetical protein